MDFAFFSTNDEIGLFLNVSHGFSHKKNSHFFPKNRISENLCPYPW